LTAVASAGAPVGERRGRRLIERGVHEALDLGRPREDLRGRAAGILPRAEQFVGVLRAAITARRTVGGGQLRPTRSIFWSTNAAMSLTYFGSSSLLIA
jgi:hypothetical protein